MASSKKQSTFFKAAKAPHTAFQGGSPGQLAAEHPLPRGGANARGITRRSASISNQRTMFYNIFTFCLNVFFIGPLPFWLKPFWFKPFWLTFRPEALPTAKPSVPALPKARNAQRAANSADAV